MQELKERAKPKSKKTSETIYFTERCKKELERLGNELNVSKSQIVEHMIEIFIDKTK